MLRIDELEINTELKLISYDRREEGKCQESEILFSASETRHKETRVWYLCFGMAQCRASHILENRDTF